MREKQSFFWNKTISGIVVCLTIFSAFAGISFLSAGAEGGEGPLAPIAAGKRMSGEVKLGVENTADMTYLGTDSGEFLGWSSATADINNDGYNDMIIASREKTGGAGVVYVYYGMKNTRSTSYGSVANITLTVTGTATLGSEIEVNDFNNDGVDDIILGARASNSGDGKAYLFFGNSDWPDQATYNVANTADVVFIGETDPYTTRGLSFSIGSGDVDGDGISEVILFDTDFATSITSPYYLYYGKMYIWWGRTSWNPTYNCNLGEYDVSILGKNRDLDDISSTSYYEYIYLGYGETISGDLNNDGRDEILIGSHQEYYYSSISSPTYNYYAGALHIIEGGARSLFWKNMTMIDMFEKNASRPKHHWIYSPTSYDYFGFHPRIADMDNDGENDIIVSHSYVYGSPQKTMIIWGDGTLDHLGGSNWTSRIDIASIGNKHVIDGICHSHIDDFDKDGYLDILGGDTKGSSTTYAGGAHLFYGDGDWSGITSIDHADFTVLGDINWQLAYAYGRSLLSNDFDLDGYPDIIIGAYAGYGTGAVFVFLSSPVSGVIKNIELLDGEGVDHDILTPEVGGNRYEPSNGKIGDGVFTFKVSYNNSFNVMMVNEIRIDFKLKKEYTGLVYSFAYSLGNNTYFIYESYGGGIEILPDRSRFVVNDFKNAEVYFSIRITTSFLTDRDFDVNAMIRTAKFENGLSKMDWLHVEFGLGFDKLDMTVLQEEETVTRGASISSGPPLVLTNMRVVHSGTDVSPLDDKFFLRVIDSYGRVFENHTSAGKDIYFTIPTNVESGRFSFSLKIVIRPEFAAKYEDRSLVPEFIVIFDLDGPEAPQNLAIHADSEYDPEGRWDNDYQIWASWDPAFDPDSGIDHYEYLLDGPGGYSYFNSTPDLMAEFALGADGVYYLSVWGVDKVGNPGEKGTTMFVKDTGMIRFSSVTSSYLGGNWFSTNDVRVVFNVDDVVLDPDGPHIRFSTLEYAVTGSMTESARDQAEWKRPGYSILGEEQDGVHYRYAVSAVITNLVESDDNYVWFRVNDQAGNT
ncbi:MAG: VCBS repeat-containing protein, partial [Candidatus Thermoplasmatota archaeon]|nr:VCBS repeat-containing protein [Candidatus Thermoplasmatota archaeon]